MIALPEMLPLLLPVQVLAVSRVGQGKEVLPPVTALQVRTR
jgi:hypothetical protein